MNKMSQYPADANLITANALQAGQDFIYNYAGGQRTVYRATRVTVGGGRVSIEYMIPTENGSYSGHFFTAGLSTLVLVD